MARPKKKFYAEKAPPQAADSRFPDLDLAGASALAGLEAEVDLVRALVKRAVQINATDEARRLMVVLCGALRLQRTLAGQPLGDHHEMLEELLKEVGLAREQTSSGADQ